MFSIYDKTNVKYQFFGEIHVSILFYLPVPGWWNSIIVN